MNIDQGTRMLKDKESGREKERNSEKGKGKEIDRVIVTERNKDIQTDSLIDNVNLIMSAMETDTPIAKSKDKILMKDVNIDQVMKPEMTKGIMRKDQSRDASFIIV